MLENSFKKKMWPNKASDKDVLHESIAYLLYTSALLGALSPYECLRTNSPSRFALYRSVLLLPPLPDRTELSRGGVVSDEGCDAARRSLIVIWQDETKRLWVTSYPGSFVPQRATSYYPPRRYKNPGLRGWQKHCLRELCFFANTMSEHCFARTISEQISICGQCRKRITTSTSSKNSTSYLTETIRFDVSSKGSYCIV